MPDFYRISIYSDPTDTANKIKNALTDVGYTATVSGSEFTVKIPNAVNDEIYFNFDVNSDLRMSPRYSGGTKFSWANYQDEKMMLGGNVSEFHLIGWTSPMALLVAFRRTDEVWVMMYLGALDNVGGNPVGHIFSHSNQYYDNQLVDGYSVSRFPLIDRFNEFYQMPLFAAESKSYDHWSSIVNLDISDATEVTYWRRALKGDGKKTVILPLVALSFYYKWNSNLGWRKLQAVNPDYDFPAQLLPVDVYWQISEKHFCPLGNVSHVRATKRNGINALERVSVGGEEFLMLPWSRAGERANGIGSLDYFFAFKLTTDQITPVSI